MHVLVLTDLLEAEPSLLGALCRPVHHGVLLIELPQPAPRDPRAFYHLLHVRDPRPPQKKQQNAHQK